MNIEENKNIKINQGIEPQTSINIQSIKAFKKKQKKLRTVDEYIKGIAEGDKVVLSQAITLIESTLPEHQKTAQEIIEKCLKKSGNSIRIGITGVPGAGKSTFIEQFGLYIIDNKKKLAVLAIDPTSEFSRGSILGDKTRMENLSQKENVFIRPSPSAGTLGGVARKTRETIILCEAAGFDTVFIETVGVGQSETMVHSMVDFFLLLTLAGAGDELQGIKRGIIEMADCILITKADGDNIHKAKKTQQEFMNALNLFPMPSSGYKPQVLLTSAFNRLGIDQTWEQIINYINLTKKTGYFKENRKNQSKYWFHETIENNIKWLLNSENELKEKIIQLENDVVNNHINPFQAANLLIDEFISYLKK